MNFKNILCVTMIAIFSLTLTQVASAVPMLDQSYFDSSFGVSTTIRNSGGNASETWDRVDNAQTFTVGLEGLLSSIDVAVYKGVFEPLLSLDLAIYSVDASGFPGTDLSPLATASLMPDMIEFRDIDNTTFANFDVSSSGLFVGLGEAYTIVLTTAENNTFFPYAWARNGVSSPEYSSGQAFTRRDDVNSFAWTQVAGFGDDYPQDYFFRTYVDPDGMVPVPEPSSLLLLGTGLIGIGAFRRKFKV